MLKSGLSITNQIREFCYSFDQPAIQVGGARRGKGDLHEVQQANTEREGRVSIQNIPF